MSCFATLPLSHSAAATVQLCHSATVQFCHCPLCHSHCATATLSPGKIDIIFTPRPSCHPSYCSRCWPIDNLQKLTKMTTLCSKFGRQLLYKLTDYKLQIDKLAIVSLFSFLTHRLGGKIKALSSPSAEYPSVSLFDPTSRAQTLS